jgi:hypothetical protein
MFFCVDRSDSLCKAFFGTPHGGSHLASVLSVLAAITPGVSSTLIKFLAKDSEPLNQLSMDFSVIGPRYKIVSFYEEEIYPGLSQQVRIASCTMYVCASKDSISIGRSTRFRNYENWE